MLRTPGPRRWHATQVMRGVTDVRRGLSCACASARRHRKELHAAHPLALYALKPSAMGLQGHILSRVIVVVWFISDARSGGVLHVSDHLAAQSVKIGTIAQEEDSQGTHFCRRFRPACMWGLCICSDILNAMAAMKKEEEEVGTLGRGAKSWRKRKGPRRGGGFSDFSRSPSTWNSVTPTPFNSKNGKRACG